MAIYLITGVAGFIGSTLARAVLAQGGQVVGFDNFSTGKRENLAGVLELIDLHEADLVDLDALLRACRGADYVYHEAAIPSVPRSVKDPLGNNQANVVGTLNLLVAAREAQVRRVVYAASSSAYGDTPILPKREDMLPSPISPYATAKLAGEHYMTNFYRCYGLDTVCLRYFNVFGPRQDPGSPYSGVLAKFIAQMLEGQAPHDFWRRDAEPGLHLCGQRGGGESAGLHAPGGEVAGRVFNVATGRRTDLYQTFQILKKLTGYSGEVKYGKEREGDVKHSLADISLAEMHLGYQPKVDFEEGLERTIAWYHQREQEAQVSPPARGHDSG